MSTPNRNDPCPCGSGKKYKKCCLGATADAQGLVAQATKSAGHDVNAKNVAAASELLLQAVALHQAGMLDEAENAYHGLLRKNRNDHHALHYLGLIALQKERYAEAARLIEKAISLDSRIPAFHCNLGNAYKGLGQFDSAIAAYQQAVRLDPKFEAVYSNLGNVLLEQGRLDEAIASYQRALAFQPDFAEVRWQLAMARIHIIAESDEDVGACRAEFMDELERLSAWFDTRMELGSKAVGVYQPFFLAYQEENNRELLARYGALCARLMQYWQDQEKITLPARMPGDLVRVGIVSAHIRDHSVWNAIIKGWFLHLDPRRIELHILHTGYAQDQETAWAKSRSASFESGGKSLKQWVQAILGKQLDVLIYPEIGMDAMTVKLASLRLAPVQAASWGHPETTGLPTMDYYLSAEDLEPPDAQDGYTEQLVRLPHLGCCYHPMQVESMAPDLVGLGIAAGMPVLLCPGAPFKYAPRHDHVLVEIAAKLGQCQFVFFTHKLRDLSKKLQQRLELAFAKAGLDFSRFGVFIPWQERAAFYGLMQRSDVFLDTMGFSGFNTAMQAIECGLPVVTKQGRFMRGRLASGILRRMGLAELIAGTDAEYVNAVVRLVQDTAYRQQVQTRIVTSRPLLFDDVAPVRALEDFLVSVARQKVQSGPASAETTDLHGV